MKKACMTGIAAALIFASSCLPTGAAFARTESYTDGMFADVTEKDWYAASVRDAYALGIMRGDSANTFTPEGTLTVAEGITVAARLYENVSGKAIEENGSGEWYAPYAAYAKENGLTDDGTAWTEYDRPITRREMAVLLYNACGELPKINEVSALPDVPCGGKDTASVLSLYRAGILTGSDDAGSFLADTALTRAELAAMSVRAALPERRVTKTYQASAARTYSDAYAVIESIDGAMNGWYYDDRFDIGNFNGGTQSRVMDGDDTAFKTLVREFAPENSGVFRLEALLSIGSENGGVYIAFEDEDRDKLFGLKEKDGFLALFGNETVMTDVAIGSASRPYAVTVDFDLDAGTMTAIVDNRNVGTVSFTPNVRVSVLALGTERKGIGAIGFSTLKLRKNYVVTERFLVNGVSEGMTPSGWETDGFTLSRTVGEYGGDEFSAKAEKKAGEKASAVRRFAPVYGNVDIETFILLPEAVSGAAFEVCAGDKTVLRIETRDNAFYMNGEKLRDYIPNVWQNLHIEADTASGKAVVKLDGKQAAETSFDAAYFDACRYAFSPDKDAVMWFDDLDVYCLCEHDDYPTRPISAQTDDYHIGVNVCNLWRDSQSGEGWDAASGFAEFEPYLGYYDEGSREVADWEIKWMAEHAIDFMHICWYAPQPELAAPIKRERISYAALHDGYMNAKYSDEVGFCIMWENGYRGAPTADRFWNYIFPYWKEYYFSDDRYVRLDNKALLTVWDYGIFSGTFGGAEGTKAAVGRMESELKEMGYDGLILLFATQDVDGTGTLGTYAAIGASGSYAYHFGTGGARAEHQIDRNTRNLENAAQVDGAHFVPTVSVGFNAVARHATRSPMIDAAGHKDVCEYIKTQLDGMTTGTWRDKTLIVSTWNEYTEGTYVAPCESNGFTYLENIREVFGDTSADHTGSDARPTKEQIERCTRLYPPRRTPVSRLHEELSEEEYRAAHIDIPSLLPVVKYDMATDEGLSGFRMMFGIKDYHERDGAISGTSDSSDYAIFPENFTPFAAEDAPILHIRMKTSVKAQAEVFFITSLDGGYDGYKRALIDHQGVDEFYDYYINMGNYDRWKGDITGIRIDPAIAPGSFAISLIEFLGYPKRDPSEIPTVTVNGTALSFDFEPEVLADGDFAVTAEPKRGFFSALQLFHEWDRYTGTLTLHDREDNVYVLTVGSDTAYVNGEPRKLGFTVTRRDGLPVLHLGAFCDLLGLPYMTEGMTYIIQSCTDEERLALEKDDGFRFEFDHYGDVEDWLPQSSAQYVGTDGCLTIEPTSADPAIWRYVSFAAKDYTKVILGMRVTSALKGQTPQFFFFTSEVPYFTAERCVNGSYDLEGKQEGDTVEVVFDLTSCGLYTGGITGIRFDPIASTDTVRVDYVRFLP